MVFAGQLFLRLISSKLLSAHTKTKDETRYWWARGLKRLWSGQFSYSRKEVSKGRQGQYESGSLKMTHSFLGKRSFVQATPVATKLWIVSQEQTSYPSFPAPVQLFPVWNWLLTFGLITVLWTDACVVPGDLFFRFLKLCHTVLKLYTLF